MRVGVPQEQSRRRSHVHRCANHDDVFNDVAGQPVAGGNGIHPIVARVVPPTNSSVGGDVKRGAGVGKSVDDVGRQACNQAAVAKLSVVQIKHLHAGGTAILTSQADNELVVVRVHGVEFGVD